MNDKSKRLVLVFVLELLVYGVFVFLYLLLVLQFLSQLIQQINQTDRRIYALLCLLLIIAQGLVLDTLTATLLKSIHPRLE